MRVCVCAKSISNLILAKTQHWCPNLRKALSVTICEESVSVMEDRSPSGRDSEFSPSMSCHSCRVVLSLLKASSAWHDDESEHEVYRARIMGDANRLRNSQ